MSNSMFRTVLFLALFAAGLLRLTIPAHAADFVVTHTGDSGEGSLRQAIIDANTVTGADTITFQDGLTGTITLTDHLPQITDGLTITGPGISALTIDGGGTYNVFATPASLPDLGIYMSGLMVSNAVTAIDAQSGSVFLSNMTITGSMSRAVRVSNGYFRSESVSFIDNSGLATIEFVGNGAILWVIDSTFIDNASTDAYAGTIKMSLSDGYAMIVNTTFADNVGMTAGAISMSGVSADLIIENSTFSGNTGANAGVLYNSGAEHIINIRNSTFSGNSATTASGADAINIAGFTHLAVDFSTFSGHDSTSGSGAVGILASGVRYSTVELKNSIIANNPGTVPGALLECSFDPDKVAVDAFNNLTGDTNCPGRIGAPTNVDPVLADNGGPTRTHALLAGSNAIDRVGCSNIDQRYVDRPQGAGCDLGAFEFVPPTVVSMSPASQNIAEGANANVTLTRTGDTTAALTVSLAVTAGVGTTPADYTLSGGSISGQSGNVTVTFPAGEGTVTLNVAALADAVGAEPDNKLTFALADGADYDLGTASSVTATIPANGLRVTHTGDSGEGSLRQAITNANTDGVDSTITFADSANGTITLLSALPTIAANGTLAIEGNGQTNTIISGNDTVRVLDITSNADVTINNLTITRGKGPGEGGGIMILEATVSLNEVRVSDNASGLAGGIANYMGTLSLNKAHVTDNAAHGGGGIFNLGGSLTITESSITGNSAGMYGGGIVNYEYADGQYPLEASLYITDSIITGNDAANFAGGIFNSLGTATIIRSTITANTVSEYEGGGLLNTGEMMIEDSIISENIGGKTGGGILNIGKFRGYIGTLTITGSSISGNSAKETGGGFSSYGGIVTLTDSEIYDNSTLDDGFGGGIFTQNHYGQGELTVNNTTISDNTGGWGGGISNIDSTLVLNNTIVSGNVARRGGGINNQGGTVTLTGSTVSGNTATGNDPDEIEGGAGIWNAGTLTLNDSLISENNAVSVGGGIINTGLGSSTLNNTVVSGNTAQGGGGIFNRDGTLTVTNGSSILNNSAEFIGGGILSYDPAAVLYVTDSTVSGNHADIDGGGIYASGVATITRSAISENTATISAGGIANFSDMALIDSLISGNSASEFGGGIYNVSIIDDVPAGLRVTGSTISNNTVGKPDVGGEGGGIANDNGSVSLTESTISGNNAMYGGGGIFNTGHAGPSTLTLTGSTVLNNTTGDAGGSVLDIGGGLLNIDGTLVIVGSTISGNVASRGGGIYDSGGATTPPSANLTISSTTIAANTASVSADGLDLHSSMATLNNTILANGDEDCIAQDGGTVDANNNLFSNTAACGALEADGNIIGRDPLLGALVTSSNGNPAYYPLLAGSPAIDAGNDALIPDGLTTDQAGNPRIFGAVVDIGSVEFTANNLLTNGSFETAGAVPAKARKWQTVGLSSTDKRKCDTPTKVFAYAGSCAFKFKSGNSAGLGRSIKQKVDLTGVANAGTTLNLSAWVQAKKLTAGAKLKVKIRYTDGTTAKAVIKVPIGTYSYTRLTGTLQVTKAAAWVEIMIKAKPSTGTILVDDVWLTVAPASTHMPVTRSGSDLLPPPPAPDGFRGSN